MGVPIVLTDALVERVKKLCVEMNPNVSEEDLVVLKGEAVSINGDALMLEFCMVGSDDSMYVGQQVITVPVNDPSLFKQLAQRLIDLSNHLTVSIEV